MLIGASSPCAFTNAIFLSPYGQILGLSPNAEILLLHLGLLHLQMAQHWPKLAAHKFIKLEVMTPVAESPDDGCIAIDFHMPPICSAIVRPGRPAVVAPVISKQLTDAILSSGMINLKELSLIRGKAAWVAYLDIYCLDSDGLLFDAALLAAVAAFSHLQIPLVSLTEEGRVVTVSAEMGEGKSSKEVVNKEKRKLTLTDIAFSLSFVLHKKYILVDPNAEEESVMDSLVTVVLDLSGRLVSLYKPGGQVLAYTSTLKDCVALARTRGKELKKILNDALTDMEVHLS